MRRQFSRGGHAVRLIAPHYVKPFLKRQKNDAADAEAIVDPEHELIRLAGLIDWDRFDDAFGAYYHDRKVRRAYVDRGYRGHGVKREGLDITLSHTRGITSPTIRREMRRRNGIEPVIGQLKDNGLLERNHLTGTEGDAINVILCAADHNLRLLVRWLRLLFVLILARQSRNRLIAPDATVTITAA